MRKAATVAVAVLLLAASPESLLESAGKELERGDSIKAAEKLEAALAKTQSEPTHPLVLIRILDELGGVYLTYPSLGRESQAPGYYARALALAEEHFPDQVGLRLNLLELLGTSYSVLDRPEQARAPLEAWIELAPGSRTAEGVYHSEAASTLAGVYTALGLTDEALRLQKLRSELSLARAAIAASIETYGEAALQLDPARVYPTYTEADMPLRIAIGTPSVAARDASVEDTRRAAIRGFRAWESALARLLPWFKLEIVEEDKDAQIQVDWQRRPRGYLPARGSITQVVVDGRPVVRSRITLSAKPVPSPPFHVSPYELGVFAMHSFGSAIGLPDCWECDSMMSMQWRREHRAAATDLDVRRFEAIAARWSEWRRAEIDVALRAPPSPSPGVLADLPMINTGSGPSVVIDVADPDQTSFVVTLDTGATHTFLTRDFARALGVSVRRIKQDPYRADTALGDTLRFYVADRKSSAMEYALLGGEFMEAYVVELDFENMRVRFCKPDVCAVGDRADEQVVKLQINERRPYAKLSLGNGAVWALIDTGAQAPIAMTEERARLLGIEPDRSGSRSRSINVVGTSSEVIQRAPASLGELPLGDTELFISLSDESSARVTRWLRHETLVGIDVLLGYGVVRVDYPRKRLGLTPRKAGGS